MYVIFPRVFDCSWLNILLFNIAWFSGSYGGSDVGGMYSSSYGGDYMPRGSDVCL